eukprot:458286_1
MGCFQSGTNTYAKIITQQIDSELRVDKQDDQKMHKIFMTSADSEFGAQCLNALPFSNNSRYYLQKKSIHKNQSLLEFMFEENGSFKVIYQPWNTNVERVKWLHCFDTAGVVIWLVDISKLDEYIFEHDEVMPMDNDDIENDIKHSCYSTNAFYSNKQNGINKLLDDIEQFTEFVNCRWFHMADICVIFVGKDNLKEKIEYDGLNFQTYFPNFNGNNEINDIIMYIEQLYDDVLNSDKSLFRHIMPNIDDKEMWRKVWKDLCMLTVRRALQQRS